MTFAFPGGVTVKASRRFMDDVARLPFDIVKKVSGVVEKIREHGAYYPGLETRKIAGNPDTKFRLMDVDYSYRIVAALQGRFVFLEKVGPHDPTERWGASATLDEYVQRMEVTAATFRKREREPAEAVIEAMFGDELSLEQIAASEAVSDVLTDCLPGVLEGWNDGTLEDWMVFLSPVQRRAVDRAVTGPSRVTGGPGTGKTVVGLHRAREFAREAPDDRPILVTSFVNTIPRVLEGLFERLAPDVARRAEFHTVHKLARDELGELSSRIDEQSAKRRFNDRLYSDRERYKQLSSGARFSDDYLWEEVGRVIIGRGVGSRDAYLALQRHGRKRPMPAAIRSLVWDVYQEYLDACKEGEGVLDWNLVLRVALEQVRAHGPRRRYSAIIVDEAQDITEVGVRFLIELLDGGPEGRLMLIGDSGQRIYPGGYRLTDLGLETRGRSYALDLCYRSTDEIMQAVGALGRFLSTEEFGEDGLRSVAASTVRTGPRPVLGSFVSSQDEQGWIIDQLDPDDPAIDSTAILVPTNRAVEVWRETLGVAGIGTVRLDEYAGRPMPGVKVGTYHRAKGLEFERVFLPGLDAGFPYGDRDDDAIVEYGSTLYVAMSRARDRLLLSYAGRPSLFLEPVQNLCDRHGPSG